MTLLTPPSPPGYGPGAKKGSLIIHILMIYSTALTDVQNVHYNQIHVSIWATGLA